MIGSFLNPWLEHITLQCEINDSAVKNCENPHASIFESNTVFNCNNYKHPANYSLDHILSSKKNSQIFVVGSPAAGRIPGIIAQDKEGQIGQLSKIAKVYWLRHGKCPHPEQTFGTMVHSTNGAYDYLANHHPKKDIITVSNCQHGWLSIIAKLLNASKNPRTKMLDGIYIGSPLSFWSGEPSGHSIRFLSAGIGSLFARFMSDLCGGKFDGAWNSYNFANYNLAHTMGDKPLRDYMGRNDPETIAKMMLFNKWLKNFHEFSKDQIVEIMDRLFIGNELEQDRLNIDGRTVSFKNLSGTHVFIASDGDDISDLYSTWSWILNYYKSIDEIKKNNLRIVLCNIPKKGHLAIFSSTKVAKNYILPIAANFKSLQSLEPGLHLAVPQSNGKLKCQAMTMEQLREILPYHKSDYDLHQKMSDHAEKMSDAYETFIGPIIRSCSSPMLANTFHDFHPMRFWRNRLTQKSNLYQAACALKQTESSPLAKTIFQSQMEGIGNIARYWEKTSNNWLEFWARAIYA